MPDENKKKILIIDDDENLRLPLVDKLTMEGFDVLEAKNGEEGLDQAIKTKPDIILLDIMMPVMSGWETLGKLRKDEWGKRVKVIMLSSISDSGSMARVGLDANAGYLVKTEQGLDSILEKVKAMLESV